MSDLETLFTRLDMARIRHAQDQKEGAIDALAAVIEYLREAGANDHQTLPLNWLGDDLTAKPVGNSKPVFIGGRDGLAVAAVDALKESGLKLKTAFAEVSNAMRGEMTETQLRNLRQSLKSTDKRTPARKQYDAATAKLAALREGECADAPVSLWRKGILAMVADSYGQKTP